MVSVNYILSRISCIFNSIGSVLKQGSFYPCFLWKRQKNPVAKSRENKKESGFYESAYRGLNSQITPSSVTAAMKIWKSIRGFSRVFYPQEAYSLFLTRFHCFIVNKALQFMHSCLSQQALRPIRGISTVVFILLLSLLGSSLHAQCVGRFVNPVTDICWKCLFPLKIASFTVASGGPDPAGSGDILCECEKPIPRIGIPVSFWEPARLVDVTRTPYCLVNMGGIRIANTGTRGRGDIEEDQDNVTGKSFYQVHWYVYPVIYWLELLMDFICLESMSIDLAYVSELDPLWNDDEKNTILNPEGVLFGNMIAQAACAGDCIAATSHLPLDPLFWCGGCQGSLYPFTGTIDHHTGGVQASLLIVQKIIARLHREGLLWGYMGEAGLCGKYFMPFIRKSQYRTQMTYPVPNTQNCHPLGHTEIFWGAGREFPYRGSDFGYLIWRKKDCCVG